MSWGAVPARDLSVLHLCEYLTERGSPRSQGDWDAYWFVRACKAESLENLAKPIRLSLLDQRCALSAGNADAVIDWFGAVAAAACVDAPDAPIAFVPVPSSTATEGAPSAGRTALFATAVSERWPHESYVLDVLRWTEPMQKAHEGGARDQGILYEKLLSTEPVRYGERVVLVDDVLTRGGHVAACAALLWDGGAEVEFAITAARTVLARSQGPAFGARWHDIQVELEWFDPFT